MSGILSDQQPVRTDEFEGRRFHVREGAEQEYWQCDRCSRNYATIVAAARCANPNHSQILGPRIPKQYKGDLAARANGGVRAGDNGEAAPVRRKPAPETGHGGARPVVDPETDGRVKYQTEEERADARRKTHAESYQRRRLKATDSPPPDKEQPAMPEPPAAGRASWTPERRAAHSARMKQHHAERGNRTTSAPMASASSTPAPKAPNADQKPQKSMAPPRTNLEAVDVTAPAPCVVDITVPGDGRVLRVTDPSIISAMNVLNAERDSALGQVRKLEQAVCMLAETFGVEVLA